MLRLSGYILYDILRNKIIIGYTFFLLVITLGLFQVEENNSKALMSLLSVVLIAVPLISLIFTTIHFYNSYEFMELLLTQPQSRTSIFFSEFNGVAISLIIAYLIGIGLPLMLYSFDTIGLYLLMTGIVLSVIFCALAFLISVQSRDKAKGIGIALLIWFYFALLYDGLLILVLFSLSDYPTEKLTFLFSALNPIDLSRILVMLKMDIGSLMGYTGAIYKNFLGQNTGILFTCLLNLVWVIVPLWIAKNKFGKKDF